MSKLEELASVAMKRWRISLEEVKSRQLAARAEQVLFKLRDVANKEPGSAAWMALLNRTSGAVDVRHAEGTVVVDGRTFSVLSIDDLGRDVLIVQEACGRCGRVMRANVRWTTFQTIGELGEALDAGRSNVCEPCLARDAAEVL